MTLVAAECMVQALAQTTHLKANTLSKTCGVLLTTGYLTFYGTVSDLK